MGCSNSPDRLRRRRLVHDLQQGIFTRKNMGLLQNRSLVRGVPLLRLGYNGVYIGVPKLWNAPCFASFRLNNISEKHRSKTVTGTYEVIQDLGYLPKVAQTPHQGNAKPRAKLVSGHHENLVHERMNRSWTSVAPMPQAVLRPCLDGNPSFEHAQAIYSTVAAPPCGTV